MDRDIKILCLMPKYLYGDIARGLSNEYNAIYKTLSKKFKNVTFFNTFNKNINIYDLNINLVNLVENLMPDIIFTSLTSYEIYLETLKIFKKISGALIINWSSDDSWRYNQHTKLIASAFDILITTYKHAHENNLKLGKHSILSNWGCPDHWIKNSLSSQKCNTDVLFIGSAYMGRKKIINKLKRKGINIKCFGYGWEKKPISDDEISEYINQAKLTLNFSKSRGFMKQTKARIFEITGSGGFCLTEESNEISDFFIPNKEIVVFKNFNELLSKIKYFLKNNSERDKIAAQGNDRCQKSYTTSKVIEKVIIGLEKKKINKPITLTATTHIGKKKIPLILLFYKNISIFLFKIFFDKNKSIKASRRILFEIEWRLRKEKTYTSDGWCSNLFNFF